MLAALEQTAQPLGVTEHKRLFRAFLYSDTGVGKTSLACHCVENRGIAVTSDSNWVVIEQYPEIAAKWDRVPFEGFSQIRAIVQAHEEGIGRWAEYDTLLWDPTSASVNAALRFSATKNNRDVETWDDYRVTANYLGDIVREISQSTLNAIYTAHLRFPNENDAKRQMYAVRPDMPQASYNEIARDVQLIGYLFRDKVGGTRKLQVEPTVKVTAKTQIPTIPEGIYDASEIPSLVTKWKQGNND